MKAIAEHILQRIKEEVKDGKKRGFVPLDGLTRQEAKDVVSLLKALPWLRAGLTSQDNPRLGVIWRVGKPKR